MELLGFWKKQSTTRQGNDDHEDIVSRRHTVEGYISKRITCRTTSLPNKNNSEIYEFCTLYRKKKTVFLTKKIDNADALEKNHQRAVHQP